MGAIVLNRSITQNSDFIEKVSAESGQPVQKCYQCGKCTAGCPVAFAMDLTPNQVIRMVQFGMKEEVLRCRSIWLCATCETCATRCPRNVNLTRVMETLRIMSDKKGLAPPGKARNVDLFYDAFMGTVEKYGRMFEFETMLLYNLKTRQPFRDVGTGLGMFKKRKLNFIPSRVKGVGEIARIFANVRRMEGGEE